MGPLLSKLRDRCVITDDASQFLTYLADGQPSCIIEDEDLHTAVWEALSMNQRVLHVQVNSAEEHGQRSVVEAPAVPDPFRRGPDFSAPPSHRSRSHKNDKNNESGSIRQSSSDGETSNPDEPPPTKKRKTASHVSQQSYRDGTPQEQTPSEPHDKAFAPRDPAVRRSRQSSIESAASSELHMDMTDLKLPDEDLPSDKDDDADDDDRDVDERFRQTMDGQVCEHFDDGFWVRASDLVGLVRDDSSNISMWQMPGMKKPIFHWQWLAVFVCATMNSGANGLHGALLADEMGIGKTVEALGLAVFRLHLRQRWEAIDTEWAQPTSKLQHCAEDAPEDSLCPSRGTPNAWWAQCPCEPKSPLRHNHPIDGPTFFLVPTSNVDAWNQAVNLFVDLKKLRIKFSVQHGKHQMTDKMRAAIRTTAVSLPTQSKPLEPGLHYGQPQPKSSLVWILTTYQTWTSYSKQHFDKTRTYTRKINKKKTDFTESYTELHTGLWVVDECHFVKNVGKGPWKVAEQMKTQQPALRSWTLAMSGTMLTADPTDITGAVSVISSPAWDDPAHPLHHLRPDGLSAAKRTMNRHYRNPTDATTKEVGDAIRLFKHAVPNILMRRHDGSRWNGKRLIDLPPLHSNIITCRFPDEFKPHFDNLMEVWNEANLTILKKKQAMWDSKQHDSKYMRENPDRPTSLRAESVFSLARLLRVSANLPFLAYLAPKVGEDTMRWTNEDVLRRCENKATGCLLDGCPLDKYYPQLVKDCPKLRLIAKMLARHEGAPALIMSSFPEFLLVAERYVRQTLKRRTRMYSGPVEKRQAAVNAFMLMKDENGDLIDDDQPDVLLGLASTLGTGGNLQRATVVILCEPVYDPKVSRQVPKRAHRQGNYNPVHYYLLSSCTSIEALVQDKEARKAGFTADAFELTTSEWLNQIGAAKVQEDSAMIEGSTAATAIDVEDAEDAI